jgi:hypothetical protein
MSDVAAARPWQPDQQDATDAHTTMLHVFCILDSKLAHLVAAADAAAAAKVGCSINTCQEMV